MAPGEMEPLASVSRSGAGGETLEERARLNCADIDSWVLAEHVKTHND